jgi:hypothetical protein
MASTPTSTAARRFSLRVAFHDHMLSALFRFVHFLVKALAASWETARAFHG